MLDRIFGTILTYGITPSTFFICLGTAIVLGVIIALAYMFRSRYTQSFVIALAIIPAVVQLLIMIINGNIGTGIAVAGAFSLVRFRSAQGTAREICYIFLSTAIGIAVGAGYIGIAVIFCVILIALTFLFTLVRFGSAKPAGRSLRITIPESLDYTSVFDEVFDKYTSSADLMKIKTTNMGSLFRLQYRLVLKDPSKEKEFIDELRVRNGNLEITCGRDITDSDESL